MADGSNIEWTDATWNPVTGCSVISAGCRDCYAMKLAGTRLRNHPSRAGLTEMTKAGPVWNGDVRFNESWLDQPLRWAKPRKIFVCAHGDLFHENVPDEWIDKVFAVMALAPQHAFQVLTKRPKRMREYLNARNGMGNSLLCRAINAIPAHLGNRHGALEMPLPNVWLGVSVENQAAADERVPELLATPATVRFLSCEPLIGPVDLHEYLLGFPGGHPASCACGHGHGFDRCRNYGSVSNRCHKCGCADFRKAAGSNGLHWVIAGGESGDTARPSHPLWFKSLRDRCAAAKVPFFFKQWGEWSPPPEFYSGISFAEGTGIPDAAWPDGIIGWGSAADHGGDGRLLIRPGKKVAGRLLEGVEHNEFPAMPGQAL